MRVVNASNANPDTHNALYLLCEDVRRRNSDDLDRVESQEILAKAQQGDAEAIERAVLSMFWWSLRLAVRKRGAKYHDTLDTLQDACVALLRAVRTWNGSYNVAWFTHAHLRVLADLKQPRKERQTEFEESQAMFSGFIDDAIDLKKLCVTDEAEQLRSFAIDAIKQLPTNQRRVAKLTLAGLNHVDIGKKLKITKQAAQQMQKRAIKTLRALVGEE